MKAMTFLILILLTIPFSADAQSIIVNNKNAINGLTAPMLKDIFIGNVTRWKNNNLIEVVDYNANQSIRSQFTEKYIEMSVMRVYKNWIRLSLSAEVAPPKILHDQSEVIDYISKNENAIGYIDDLNLLKKIDHIKEIKVLSH